MKVRTLTAAWVRKVVPRRAAAAHKGSNGHVLLVAGSRGMAGAAILSGLGALRAGAGLLTVGIVDKERRSIAVRLPEAMTLPLPETRDGALAASATSILRHFSKERRINVLAVGPGLSQRGSVRVVVHALVKTWTIPLVLDADGLNALSHKDLSGKVPVVITPHPGELARFLGISLEAIARDRAGAAQKAARLCRAVCVLKGRGTIISDGRQTFLNPTGNPAMATGGMGDVLTGVIAGLIAQGLSPLEAACAGVYLHGRAGDLAAQGDRGLLASELAACIPNAIKDVIG